MPADSYIGSNTPPGTDCYNNSRVDAVRVKDSKNLLCLPGSNQSKLVHYTSDLSLFQNISNVVRGWMSMPPKWVAVNIQWLSGDVVREYDPAIAQAYSHTESRVVVYINASELEKVEIPREGGVITIQELEQERGEIFADKKDSNAVAKLINQMIGPLIYRPKK